MKFLPKTSLKRKQMVIIMLTTSVALLLACAAFAAYEVITFRKEMARNLTTLGEIVGDNSAAALDFNDPKGATDTLAALKVQPNIIGACIFLKNGNVFAQYHRAYNSVTFSPPMFQKSGLHFGRQSLALYQPIDYKGDLIGVVYLESDLQALYARLTQYVLIAAGVFLLTLLAAFFLSNRLQRVISEPILQLVETTHAVARGRNYSLRAVKKTQDELGELIDGFNEMLSQIQQRDLALESARENLEKKVEERTRDLQRENAERKRAEETLAERLRLAALGAELGVALTRQTDLRAILGKCAESIARHLDLAMARIWTLNRETNALELQASAGTNIEMSNAPQRAPEWKFKAELIAEERKPRLNNNVAEDPGLNDRAWVKREGITAFAGYPLIVGDSVVGVMAMFSREPFSEEILKELASIADGIALGITREQTEAELAYERDLLRALLDNSPDHIYFKDFQSRFISCSKSLCEQFGTGRLEQIIGKCDFDFFSDEHARPAFEDEQQIIRTGIPLIGKIEKEVRKDGKQGWVLTSKMPLRNKAGAIIGTFGISKDITAIKEAEGKLEEVHRQLLATSRMAGMAEVATSVLHNVGNVLNSVNVSSNVIVEKMRNSKAPNLGKAVALMRERADDLPGFFANDPKGKQLPGYLTQLAEHLVAEQQEMLRELASLSGNIDHIKEIVAMQQSYAKVSGVREKLDVTELVEDALRMNAGAMERHGVRVIREYSAVPPILIDKHKVLQILVNLIRNAKYAVDESRQSDKRMKLRVALNGKSRVKISVVDNGVGIAPENLNQIFGHGFTTRKDGHGFGLHSGALAAREMGGSLSAHSDGPGQGATFTLEIPGDTTERNA